MDCLSCERAYLGWDREPACAIYTTRVGNRIPLCSTCFSLWLRNAATDFDLAPLEVEYL